MSIPLDVVPIRNNNASKGATASLDSADVQVFIGADRRASCMAKIRRVATGSINLVVPRFISPSQNVQIVYLGCRIQARVVRCTELPGDNHLATVHLLSCAGMEMRSEPRLPIHLDATLQILGSAEKLAIRIVDISQSGLGVAVPITLTVGQQVAVDVGQGIALAEVRYCRVTPEGKRAGLQVLEFLEREHPLDAASVSKKDGCRPGLSRVISMIRSKHNDSFAAEPGKS
jgi:hypothetical protein